VITIWTVQYSLYHVSVHRVGAINNINWCVAWPVATLQWILILFMTQGNEDTSKTTCPKTYWPRFGDQKWRNPRSGQSSNIMQIFTPLGCPQVKHIFRGLPWELPSYAIQFWKALVEPIWQLTLRLTVFEIFGFWRNLGVPQRESRPVRDT